MSPGLLQRLDRLARRLSPFALSVLLVLVCAVPNRLPGLGAISPDLALMAVFYWTIYRPELLRPPAVFAIGLFQDILLGTVPGTHVVVLLVAQSVLAAQRRLFRGRSFAVIWWAFAMVALGAAGMIWLITMVLNRGLIDPAPVVFEALVATAVYPFMTRLFARVQQGVLRQG